MNPVTLMRVAARLQEARRRDKWTPEQLRAYQKQRLAELRQHAYARSRFYQRFHAGLFDAPLAELPPLNKATLMTHYDEVVTDPRVTLAGMRQHLSGAHHDELYLGEYRIDATSGSTGQPGVFLSSKQEWLSVLTSFACARELAGFAIHLNRRTKMTSVASNTDWHISSRIGREMRSWLTPNLKLSATEPLETIADALNAWQPHLVGTYPSMAHDLAKQQQAGKLRIQPEGVFTSGEPMTPEWRAEVEATWGKRLFNNYTATETAVMASECAMHTGLHLLEDLLYCEVVDADNRPVPDGEFGEKMLVSVLFSRTAPLIRYEISDSLKLAPELCPCGRPSRLIEEIRGRAAEFFWVPGKSGGMVRLGPLAVMRITETAPIVSWQLQVDEDQLKMLVVGMPDEYEPELLERLNGSFADLGAAACQIQIEHVHDIPRGATGKAVPMVVKQSAALQAGATAAR